jgi:Neuraminidase (sialidase)
MKKRFCVPFVVLLLCVSIGAYAEVKRIAPSGTTPREIGGKKLKELKVTLATIPLTEPKTITDKLHEATPAIATDSAGGIVVVMSPSIFRSTNRGETWSSLQKLPFQYTWNHDVICEPSGAIDVAVDVSQLGQENSDIHFLRSTNQGRSWAARRKLSNDPVQSKSPSIAAGTGGHVYMAWSNDMPKGHKFYQIHLSHSADNGSTWSAPVKVAGDRTTRCYSPQLAVRDSGDLYLIWSEKHGVDDWRIHFMRSTDGGSTWPSPSTIAAGESIGGPRLALGQGTDIYVAWFDRSVGNGDIFLSRSKDNGVHWEAIKGVPNNMNESISPALAVGPGRRIHLAWTEDVGGNSEIFLTRSLDGGNSWYVPVNASDNERYSRRPDIAVDGSGKLCIVWLDKVPWQRGLEKHVVKFSRESQ